MDKNYMEQNLLCEECLQEGHSTLAEYFYSPEENSLEGPSMGDPDFWPVSVWKSLCAEHYYELTADLRLDYFPLSDDSNIC